MEITKTVPVTIEIDDDNKRDCSGGCCFNVEGCYCARFDVTTINGRNDGCLAEFGTGEKPAVVQWEDSKIGDVVEIEGKNVYIHEAPEPPPGNTNYCDLCCFGKEDDAEPCRGLGDCDCLSHPSGCGVYFTEVKE